MRELPVAELDEAASEARPAFEALRGSRLLVTGGTGFFGRWMLETLLRADAAFSLGVRALVLTRDPARFRVLAPAIADHPSVALHEGDVRSSVFPPGPLTHALHMATQSSPKDGRAETPQETVATVVDGTRRVLDACRASGVRRLLFASSGAVYGRQPPDLAHVSEDYRGAPDCMDLRAAYGHAKRLAEQLCAQASASGGPECVVARPFAFAGPLLPLDAHFAIGNFVRDGLAGGPIRVAGDGTAVRSYLYASDLAVWLWTILAAGRPCRPYNVGSENGVAIARLAERVAARFGTSVEIARRPEPGVAAERYVPMTQRARDELGLRERVGLDEAIDRMARWHIGRGGRGLPGT